MSQIFVASMVANPCTIDNIQKHFNNSTETNSKSTMGEAMNNKKDAREDIHGFAQDLNITCEAKVKHFHVRM